MKQRGIQVARRRRRSVRTARRAGAVVEMAVVTPLLLSMMLGMIEFGWVFMIQQSLTNAAREACRFATLPGTSDAEVIQRVSDSVSGTGVEISGTNVQIARGTPEDPTVTVTVSVPYSDVTLLGVLPSSLFSGFYSEGGGSCPEGDGGMLGKAVGSSCSMRAESGV